MTWLFRFCMVSVMAAVSMPACGARFPNAVERSFTLSGATAAAAAAFFGLAGNGPSSLALRLGPGEAWAVYLLKQDTPEPLYNDNNGSPPRDNIVAFTGAPAPALTIGPFWLDQGTQLPAARPGYFTFGSPFMPEGGEGTGPWAELLRHTRQEEGWTPGAWPEFQRCFGKAPGAELCVEVYRFKEFMTGVERNGHSIALTLHPG
jgi:hypothetical protein